MLGIIGYVLLINGAAFAAFGFDKTQARTGGWRVSERTLLLMSAAGGWIGAKSGQLFFRHKTRKYSFKSALNSIPFGYALAGGLWIAHRGLGLF